MKVAVIGSIPRDFGLSKETLKTAAASFAERSRSRVGGVWHEVVVHLVRDAASDELHRAILGETGATDVITQAYEAIPPEPPGLLGELFVNVDQARRAAPRRRGWSPAKELLLYVAHGMDHLSGAGDHASTDYRRMRRRELAWLTDVLSSTRQLQNPMWQGRPRPCGKAEAALLHRGRPRPCGKAEAALLHRAYEVLQQPRATKEKGET